jgi:hypothetical protein
MPTYVYDRSLDRLVERGERPRLPSGPQIMPDLPPHKSPVDGTVIEGRAQRREYLKRHGLREVDPTEWKPLRPYGEARRLRKMLRGEA